MPPRRRTNHSNTGFTGVRLRPGGCFAAEISAAGVRVWLGTFNSKEEAARAYDAAVWRFARPCHQMNFPEVSSLEEATFLAPVPQFASAAEERHHRQGQRRITIAEVDEQFMAQWRREHPQDMVNMRNFWKEKQVERRAKRVGKRQRRAEYEAEYAKGDASAWSPNDERWLYIISTTASEDTPSDDESIDWD
ncbi:hypothetical protein QYE76_036941 [Lolium multiflorum]|uniref:AP2/ERF domain-containing protein n=1 Tax=Lolium multiflorum TaxID=4521 RepID=A0AAD8R1Y8_LOLMU|nr:hypothetical protein QYE76_036941 [Lolium multiflorum]